MPGSPAWDEVVRSVRAQTNYLNPVIHTPNTCAHCFGAMYPGSGHCYNCTRAWDDLRCSPIDLVCPITYRLAGKYRGQAAHDLRLYKADQPSTASRQRLLCLFWHFCHRHLPCLKQQVGIEHFTHVAFMPSTRKPGKEHPLRRLLGPLIPLTTAELRVNAAVDPKRRLAHAAWFAADPIADPHGEGASVLLIDDTWVSGARMYSAAHQLKQCGADVVVGLVLARQLNPDFEPARPVLAELDDARYDPEVCAWHATKTPLF